MADSSKRGWRQERSPRGGRRAVVGDGSRVWQSKKVDTAQSAAFYHRMKLLGLGLLATVLIVVFIVIVVFWPRKVPIHTIVVTEYQEVIPPNAYAREDALQLARTNAKSINMADMCMENVGRSRFHQFLDSRLSQRPGGPGHDTAIFYISAHGVVDEKGRPCLLLSDSHPLDSTTWLPMREVIARLDQEPRTRKVLILDAGKIDTHWRMGVLHNGFADGLASLTEKVQNLYILNSTHGSQRSWAAPELDGSVFGHFVTKGLRGEASLDDNKVTLEELFNYVRSHVEQWVVENRAAKQRPMLVPNIPDNGDFPLVFRGASLSDEEEQSQRDRVAESRSHIYDLWERVHTLWERLETSGRNHSPFRTDPVAVAQIQRQLLRMEQLLLAGEAYAEEFEAVGNQASSLLERLSQKRVPEGLQAYCFPLTQQWDGVSSTSADTAEKVAAWVNAGGKPKPEEKAGDPPSEYLPAAAVAWQFLLKYPEPGLPQLRDALSLVDQANGRVAANGATVPDLVEVHFLRMLQRHLDRNSSTDDIPRAAKAGMHLAIGARHQAEMAAAPQDERVHYWVQPLVNAADEKRRLAEDQMFVGDAAALNSAQATLTELVKDDADAGFSAALDRAGQVTRYFEIRDRTWADAPHLVQWVLRQGPSGRGEHIATTLDEMFADVQTVATRNHRLAAALDKATVEGEFSPSPTLEATFAEVEQSITRLRASYADYCQYLKDRAGQDAPTSREIEDALRLPTPLVAAGERARLSVKLLDIYFAQGGLDEVAPAQQADTSTEQEEDRPTVKWLADMSPHPALLMLDRSNLELLLNLWTPDEDLNRSGESDAAWLAQQGGQVRRYLAGVEQFAEDLEDVTNVRLREASETATNTRAGASEADRLVRAAAALLGDAFADPAHRLREVDRHFQALWFCRRTLDDFWGPTTIARAASESYFDQVATSYLKSARLLDDTPTSLVYDRSDLSALLRERRAAARGTRVEPDEVRTLGEEPLAPHQVRVTWQKGLPAGGMAALFLQQADPGQAVQTIPVKDNELAEHRRQGIRPGEPLQTEIRHSIATEQIQDKTSATLSANVLFRGHLLGQPFSIRWPQQVLVTQVEPRALSNAKVTVQGNVRRRGWIMFILDCSASMDTENQDGNRFGKAQLSLRETLDAMQHSSNYYVGLSAYGHRSRWAREGGSLVPVFKRGLPAARRPANPDEDFEPLVPMQQLEKNHYIDLIKALGDVAPYGVTPLYWSLQECLRNEFGRARPGDAKHIILITDGLNETIDKQLASPSSVLEAWRKKPDVRIDILFVDKKTVANNPALIQRITGGAAAIKRHIEDLEKLAKTTGGQFFEPEAQALTKTLRDALKLVKFSVAETKAPQVPDEDRLDLGRAKVLNDLRGGRQSFRVELHDAKRPAQATVEIEGGEWLLVEYDESSDRLIHPEYARGDARDRVDISDPKSSDRYRVTAILPEKNQRNVTFFVAVQKHGTSEDEWQFTRRPEHVWAVIQPQQESGRSLGPPYHFYDPLFVAGVPVPGQPAPDKPVPVPVFRFSITDWPEEATQATIRFSFRYDVPPVKPNGKADVDPVAAIEIAENIPEVDFRAEMRQIGEGREGYRVTVWERHDRDTDLYSARVQASPMPDQIAHTYYVGVDTVKHEFDYQQATRPTILVTAREQITNGAITVPKLRVQVKE